MWRKNLKNGVSSCLVNWTSGKDVACKSIGKVPASFKGAISVHDTDSPSHPKTLDNVI